MCFLLEVSFICSPFWIGSISVSCKKKHIVWNERSSLMNTYIGNAKLAGLQADLHVSDDAYNWALSIFFIGYIIFEIPSNMMLKKIGPNRWIPLVMVTWGVVSLLMSQVTNTAGLLACRFFLGLTGKFEGGPMQLVSHWSLVLTLLYRGRSISRGYLLP